MEERRIAFASLAAAGLLAAACGAPERRAELEVELVPPVVSRFVVHGDCFAGWYMSADLIVHERNGSDVVLDAVSLRVVDEGTAGLLGERMLDAAALQEPERGFGPSGPLVRGHGTLRIKFSIGALPGSVDAPSIRGPVVASGEIFGLDDQGRVSASFRLTAGVTIDTRALPNGGACMLP